LDLVERSGTVRCGRSGNPRSWFVPAQTLAPAFLSFRRKRRPRPAGGGSGCRPGVNSPAGRESSVVARLDSRRWAAATSPERRHRRAETTYPVTSHRLSADRSASRTVPARRPVRSRHRAGSRCGDAPCVRVRFPHDSSADGLVKASRASGRPRSRHPHSGSTVRFGTPAYRPGRAAPATISPPAGPPLAPHLRVTDPPGAARPNPVKQ
jgi:hypothetical protein